MKKIDIIFLLIILFISSFFRLYKLGSSPQGFYLDEAAIGYNAYSILHTGKDEFGKYFPLVFRSFVDFKAPVYSYLLVPLFCFFEPSEFLVRLPSAIAGILTVVSVYFLIMLITDFANKRILAFLSSLFLAISPWHILFSRTTYETNLALFFLILGIYFFYKSLKKPFFFILAIILLTVSSITYHAERLIAPVVLIFLILNNYKIIYKKFIKNKTPYLIGFLLACVIALPTLFLFKTPGFLSRINTLNIFSTEKQNPAGFVEDYKGLASPIVNNVKLLQIKEFLSLYTSYFSPRYMFYLGDYGPRSSYPDLSTFYIWQFPLYIYGLYILLKTSKINNLKFIVFLLLLLSPIPAAMTRDPYSTIRSEVMVVPMVIIMSLGLQKLIDIDMSKYKKYVVFILSLLIFFSCLKVYASIFKLNNYFRASFWDYGYKEVIEKVNNLEPKLPILVDNSRGEPYVHFLFFLKYPPLDYQENNFEVSEDNYYSDMNRNMEKNIGRIKIKKFDWSIDTNIDQYIISDELCISEDQIENHDMKMVDKVLYPDGSVAFRIIRTRSVGL